MTLFEDFRERTTANVFRAQAGVVAVAPHSAAALTKSTLFNATRTATITTTDSSTAITGTGFTSADVGAAITGTGIAADTTIASVGSATAAVLSQAATAAGTPTVTIVPAVAFRGTLKALPTGWTQFGWCSTDGITQARDTTISDTPAWGAAEPILRVVTATTKTMAVTALESNRIVEELYYLADLSSVEADDDGIVNYQEPDLPRLRDYRMLALAKFENADGEWYEAVQYPRAAFSPNGDEVWDLGDNGTARPLLATAQVDDVLGYAVEHFKAGPGFHADVAGYSA